MKERKGRSIILPGKSHLSKSVCGRSGKFAVVIIAQYFLEVRASAGWLVEISIALAKREVDIRPARASRVIVEIFLIFRERQIIEFASEKRVCVIELATVGRFAIARYRSRRILCRTARKWRWRFLKWKSSRNWRLIYRLG